MLLIDRRGQRVRPVCRECRKVVRKGHRCPKQARALEPDWREIRRVADDFSVWVARYREAQRVG